jgi:hypothetical protein
MMLKRFFSVFLSILMISFWLLQFASIQQSCNKRADAGKSIEWLADDAEEQTDEKESKAVCDYEHSKFMYNPGASCFNVDKSERFFQNDDQANHANHSLKVYTPPDTIA